jgi:hypothetical protein
MNRHYFETVKLGTNSVAVFVVVDVDVGNR